MISSITMTAADTTLPRWVVSECNPPGAAVVVAHYYPTDPDRFEDTPGHELVWSACGAALFDPCCERPAPTGRIVACPECTVVGDPA